MKAPVFIIAEAGVNHNGDVVLARQLIDAAESAGADAVKFQTFKAENLVLESADKAEYQKNATDKNESQLAMLKRLELSYESHHELINYCLNKNIQFLSTAFDFESLNFLVEELGLKILKISSGEITNGPLLLAHAMTGCDLIVSTGMATLGEIEEALSVIAFGLIKGTSPSRMAFKDAYISDKGQQLLKEKVTLLHCTTEYPAPLNDINLKAMQSMKKIFSLKTGYSDHSEGITVPIAAAALGACLIEKHFTLDKSLPGPDHKASLEPDELTAMISAVRTVEKIMGSGLKEPQPSEISNRNVARKSLIACKDVSQGEKFTNENLTSIRPGSGRTPMDYWDIIGSKADIDISAGEFIK